MSIMLRGSKNHYRFRMNGVDHSGVCLGCEIPSVASPREILSIKKKAKQFEAEVKLSVTQEISQTQQAEAEIRKNKTVRPPGKKHAEAEEKRKGNTFPQ